MIRLRSWIPVLTFMLALGGAGCAHPASTQTPSASRAPSAGRARTTREAAPAAAAGWQTVHAEGFAYDIPDTLLVERDGDGYVHHSRGDANLTMTLVADSPNMDIEAEAMAALDRLVEYGARVHYDGVFEQGTTTMAVGQAILEEVHRNMLVLAVRTPDRAYLIECSDSFEAADAMADLCMKVARTVREER